MEEAGAKAQEISARRREAERRSRTARSAPIEERSWSRGLRLLPSMEGQDLVESEQLWREIFDRYEDYYGGMGAEAIKDLLGRLDLDAEIGAAQRGPRGQLGPEAPARHQAPQGRQAVRPGVKKHPRR
jgi:hypothetical protein